MDEVDGSVAVDSRVSRITAHLLADLRLMKMKKAAHGWTANIEKRYSGGRRWRFSDGLPKFYNDLF